MRGKSLLAVRFRRLCNPRGEHRYVVPRYTLASPNRRPRVLVLVHSDGDHAEGMTEAQVRNTAEAWHHLRTAHTDGETRHGSSLEADPRVRGHGGLSSPERQVPMAQDFGQRACGR